MTKAKKTKKKPITKKKLIVKSKPQKKKPSKVVKKKKLVKPKKVTKKKVIPTPVPVEIPKPVAVKVSEQKEIIATPQKRPAKYLNNKDLLAEVLISKKQQKMTDKLAKMLMLLVERYSKKGSFVNYTYNNDMQSYALLMICKTWQGFDPAKSSNPFAWFTQCVKNSFIQYLKYEQRHRDTKDKVLVENGMNPSFGYAYDLLEEQKNAVDPVEHEVVDAPTKFVDDVDPFDDLPDTEENAPKEAY